MSRADGWRLRVSHETRFDYGAPARASYNELRLVPRTEVRQTALEARVVTVPAAPQYSYIDYWGTHVVAFNVDRNHDALSITGTALVDTQPADEPEDCTWSDIGDASLTMADHLSHNLYTSPGAELAQLSAQLRAARPLDTARHVVAAAHDSLHYALRHHDRPHVSERGLRRRCWGVPGLCPSVLVVGASSRPALSLRIGLLPSRTGRDSRRGDHCPEPRVGRVLDRRLVGLRPDQRLSGRLQTHRGRPRPGLRGRATRERHLRRQRGEHHAGGGTNDTDTVSTACSDAQRPKVECTVDFWPVGTSAGNADGVSGRVGLVPARVDRAFGGVTEERSQLPRRCP